MEKRNRLDRRGQSPPPDVPNRVIARVAAASALGLALAVVVSVVGVSAGVGSTFLLMIGALSTMAIMIAARLISAIIAWLNYKTALVDQESARLNHETAKINQATAQRGLRE